MSYKAIRRLLAPRSIALFGGVWADAVAAASRAIGYDDSDGTRVPTPTSISIISPSRTVTGSITAWGWPNE